jgi:pimeloyl-ACP methyl ester carboxylesterase
MNRIIRVILKLVLWTLIATIVITSIYTVYAWFHVKKVVPDTEANYTWPYYVYVNQGVKKKAASGEKVFIMVFPNNTMSTSDSISKDDMMSRITAVFGNMVFGDLNTIILVPVFPRPSEHNLIYTHALDRDVLTTDIDELKRLDLQLVAIIDDVRTEYAEEGWDVDSKVLLWGFSASGMFVNRFSILHPDRVLATSIGSPGGWPIAPVGTWEGESLRYPVGISDIEELTGERVDIDAYREIPQLFYLGEYDENDSVPYDDSYEDEDAALIYRLFGDTPVQRWPIAEKMYKEAGTNTTFILYENAGHRPTLRSFRNTKELFREVMKE